MQVRLQKCTWCSQLTACFIPKEQKLENERDSCHSSRLHRPSPHLERCEPEWRKQVRLHSEESSSCKIFQKLESCHIKLIPTDVSTIPDPTNFFLPNTASWLSLSYHTGQSYWLRVFAHHSASTRGHAYFKLGGVLLTHRYFSTGTAVFCVAWILGLEADTCSNSTMLYNRTFLRFCKSRVSWKHGLPLPSYPW